MRRLSRPLLNGLIVFGLLIALLPLGQTMFGIWNQRTLAAQWQQQNNGQIAAANVKHNPNSPTLAGKGTKKKNASWPLTKFSAPDIGLTTYVVQGMDPASLKKGPGHDPFSSAPGIGNCVIAAHRNIYGSFFYQIDQLLPGAPITLENKSGKWTYTVSRIYSTPDTDFSVLDLPPANTRPLLTLITCTLPHSNYRLIVQAELKRDDED